MTTDFADRNGRIIELWDTGLTASQVAICVGDGLTRNAVIGVVRRSGRVRKANMVLAAPVHSEPSPPRPAAPKPKIVSDPEPIACGPINDFPTSRNHCRWIHGDVLHDESWQCCGAECKDGSPYCAHHSKRTYSITATEKSRAKFAEAELGSGIRRMFG